jgi:hypothetical protein
MTQSSNARAWAWGGTVFAATVMLIVGIFQILEGIAAIAKDQFFIVANGLNNYAYDIDTTGWGWIVVVAITGFFLYTAMTWARVVGIFLASLSAIANFLFLPYYPFWSLLIVALNIFVIWSLATTRRYDRMGETMAAGGFAGESMQTSERWTTTNPPGGRHYAGEPAKEGVRGTMEDERASATTQPPPSGQQQYSGGQQQQQRYPQGPPPR